MSTKYELTMLYVSMFALLRFVNVSHDDMKVKYSHG